MHHRGLAVLRANLGERLLLLLIRKSHLRGALNGAGHLSRPLPAPPRGLEILLTAASALPKLRPPLPP